MSGELSGRRVVVVGASAGVGRAFGVRAVAAGASVLLAARRGKALAEAVDEAGGGVAVTADVCDDRDRRRLADAIGEQLGGLDLLLYTVGYSALLALTDADEVAWRQALDANVVGFNQLVRLVLPVVEPGGVVAAVSSESVAQPWAALVPYTASKAALETSLRGWRLEHPGVRFSCLALGATQPTEFGSGFEAARLGPAYASWVRHGLLHERFMDTADVAAFLVTFLGAALRHPDIGIEYVVLRSPSPVRER